METTTSSNRQINLLSLVNELKDQNIKKYDFVIESKRLRMVDGNLVVANEELNEALANLIASSGIARANEMELSIMSTAHSNLSEKLMIPKRYYDKMLSHPHLLDKNVNYWLDANPKNYFLRNFVDTNEKSGVCRAFLSDKFKVIDNFDVLMAALQAIKKSGVNIAIQNCDITDSRMYVRFVCPDIEAQAPEILKNYKVPNGDTRNNGIISGFIIANSEIGHGQFSISPRAVVLACANGMIWKDEAFAKTHIGGRMEENSNIQWSEETRLLNMELVMSQVQDAITHFTDKDFFTTKIHALIEVGTQVLVNTIPTIQNVARTYSLSEDKENELLDFFIKGNDVTAFGVCQAMTYFAQKQSDADLQYTFEQDAMSVLFNIKNFDKPAMKRKKDLVIN